MLICNKCKQKIVTDSDDKSVECKNAKSCDNHGKCANLNEDEWRLIKSNENISWECDACSGRVSICLVSHETFAETVPNIRLKEFFDDHRKHTIMRGITFAMIIAFLFAFGVRNSIPGIQFKVKNSPVTSDQDYGPINHTEDALCIVNRTQWEALSPKHELFNLELPVHRIIISHTLTNQCNTNDTCRFRTRTIQKQQMKVFDWDDIGFNFLIGGDGCVYEGRGWDYQGAHTKGYNTDSYGISFIGNFRRQKPTESQIEAVKHLLEFGVLQDKISTDYRVYFSRQFSGIESPEDELFQIIKNWPQFSMNIH